MKSDDSLSVEIHIAKRLMVATASASVEVTERFLSWWLAGLGGAFVLSMSLFNDHDGRIPSTPLAASIVALGLSLIAAAISRIYLRRMSIQVAAIRSIWNDAEKMRAELGGPPFDFDTVRRLLTIDALWQRKGPQLHPQLGEVSGLTRKSQLQMLFSTASMFFALASLAFAASGVVVAAWFH